MELTLWVVGDDVVMMPETRRRYSIQDLMRRRPGRARLTADRGSQGTNAPAPGVRPSSLAERT